MVFNRLRSIEWKFPLLMSGFVLATASLFLWVAYTQFTGSLYRASGQRVRTASLLVSGLISDGVPRTNRQMLKLSTDPLVAEFLVSGAGKPAVEAAMKADRGTTRDSSLKRTQLLDRAGKERLAAVFRPGPWSDWAATTIARDRAAFASVGYGPILNVRGIPEFDVVAPVFVDSERVGYVIETRSLNGSGKTVSELIGEGSTLLLGSPGGAWTDFEKIAPAPPAFPRDGTPIVFDSSAAGPGIGVGVTVPRTPWYLWIQQPRSLVQAPIREFVRRMIPDTALITITGALLVWLLSRGVTTRIAKLTKDADRLEAVEGASSESSENAPDEIERLRLAFERMGQRLRTNRDLEGQLRQAQKLEAIGRLAGGVAHDFNNILTVVRNYSEMVRDALPPGGELAQDMNEVLKAADRANGLTGQLLAFSRRQVLNTRVLQVNELIEASQRMLRRVLPTNIELITILDPDVGCILADAGQIDQVLLNLTINAADAMPEGGRLTIHTRNASLDETLPPPNGVPSAGYKAVPAGTYASIVVTDSGTGMDRDTMSRIFDPFFTTKPVGKGTGLGLATVHGIVTQNKGSVWVYSELGRGTTFKIYFPVVVSEAGLRPHQRTGEFHAELEKPTETILIVEDDPSTRKVTQRVLAKAGYSILEAPNGEEALDILTNNPGRIDLVLTDLMMPGISGIDLAARLAELKPDLPVIMMSGYADHTLDPTVLGPHRPFIEKPFTAAGLLALIRAELRAEAGV